MSDKDKKQPNPDDVTLDFVEGSEPKQPEFPSKPQGQNLIGKKIGSCTIKRVIGSGGMGTVYEAIQDNPKRRVALKMMKQGAISPQSLRRFEFESQVLARLQHPNIAQVYEAGTHDDGEGSAPYFIMEHIVNALELTDYVESKKLGTRERLALFSKICEAVQHGHLKGIVHRDLKPANILIDSSGNPKIIDFGVARSTDSDVAVTTLQTDVGQLVGTLQYMSPEQCDADPADIDARSDVYALGVIMYELLTGNAPYDVRRAAIHEAVRMVKESEPTKISTIDKRLKGDVETIAIKALEKERSRRYQSANALEQDITNYLNDEPISARRPGSIEYLRRFARKHKAASIAFALVFTILVGAVIAISIFAVEADRQRSMAEVAKVEAVDQRAIAVVAQEAAEQQRNIAIDAQEEAEQQRTIAVEAKEEAEKQRIIAETNLKTAEAVKDFTTNIFEAVDPEKTDGMDTSLLKYILDEASSDVGENFANVPEVEVEIRESLAYSYGYGAQDWEIGLSHLTEALALSRKSFGDLNPRTLTLLMQYGEVLERIDSIDEENNYIKSEQALKEALDGFKKLYGDDHYKVRAVKQHLISTLTRVDKRLEVLTLSKELADFYVKRDGALDEYALIMQARYAQCLLDVKGGSVGGAKEGIQILERVLNGQRSVSGEFSAGTLETRRRLAIAYLQTERLDEAEFQALKALEGMNKRFSNVLSQQEVYGAHSLLSLIYRLKKNNELALEHKEMEKKGQLKRFGPGHIDTIDTDLELIDRLLNLEEYTRAESSVAAGLLIVEQHLPRDHPRTKKVILQYLALGVLALRGQGKSSEEYENRFTLLEDDSTSTIESEFLTVLESAHAQYSIYAMLNINDLTEAEAIEAATSLGMMGQINLNLSRKLKMLESKYIEDGQRMPVRYIEESASFFELLYKNIEEFIKSDDGNNKSSPQNQFIQKSRANLVGENRVLLFQDWGMPEKQAEWDSIFQNIYIDLPAVPFAVIESSNIFNDVEFQNKFNQAILKEMELQGIAGAALAIVTSNNKHNYIATYGYSDLEADLPATNNTLFLWEGASMAITAVAAMQLVESGNLNLDADIRELVPEIPEQISTITLRHLLSHKSGLMRNAAGPDALGKKTWNAPPPYEDVIEALNYFKYSDLEHTPGEDINVSNLGYVLASAVIQRASNKPYVEQVLKSIARPLEMSTLQPDYLWTERTGRSKDYTKPKAIIREAPAQDLSWQIGSRGWLSNITDFSKFARAMLANTLLGEDTQELLWERQTTKNGEASNYALGFWSYKDSTDSDRVVKSISLRDAVHRNTIRLYPNTGLGIVLLTNNGRYLNAPNTGVNIEQFRKVASELIFDYLPQLKN